MRIMHDKVQSVKVLDPYMAITDWTTLYFDSSYFNERYRGKTIYFF